VNVARRELVVDGFALALLKLLIGAWILHEGFTHVSDDDYARTVISEQFAHAPRLDPSGTSWLPFPFWIEGAAMMALGRTLGVARAVAMAAGAVSVTAPYLAMRAVGVRRAVALAATAVAMTTPWNAWLGVATVPEGWTGAIVAAALIVMPLESARPWAAVGLAVGSLARYETWPACGAMAALCVWHATRSGNVRRELAWAGVALAGPLAWMAWNAHAHDGPLHFVTRVATFRQAIGAAAVPLADKLAGYPRVLASEAPVAALLGLAGLIFLRRPEARARWGWPAAAALGILVFLVWGDVRDGAPTHHAARALVAVTWVLTAMGVDAAFALAEHLRARPSMRIPVTWGAVVVLGLVAGAAILGWSAYPGSTEAEQRGPQIARGLDLRARHVAAATITPCSFEHFALLAAWGQPERSTVLPRTGAPPTPACPLVEER